MPKSLRTFLSYLENQEPREFLRIFKQIDPPRFEASCIVKKLADLGKRPAILFENTTNVRGEKSEYQLLMGYLATQRRAEIVLDLEPGPRVNLIEEYWRREGNRIKPLVVNKGEAPIKEVVKLGKQVDLAEMPVVRQSEMDGNPYFDLSVVAYDPEHGYNAGYHRMMYLDSKHTCLYMQPRHLWIYFQKKEKINLNLPVAIVIGHHPAFYMGSLTMAPLDTDEYELIGSIMGEPLRLVPSEMYGDQLLVPADAEVVIEGELVANTRAVEGPFGEWTDYYGPQRLRWLFEATAVTHRKNPILMYHMSGNQYMEEPHVYLALEGGVLRAVRNSVPSVVAVALEGRGLGLNCVIALSREKRIEGEPMRAAMAAFGADANVIKNVIVVDDDIDPWDMTQVMWAISMRCQAEKDVTILRGLKSSPLDPSSEHEVAASGMIVDATIPLNRPFERVINMPRKVLNRINLEEYVNPDYLK